MLQARMLRPYLSGRLTISPHRVTTNSEPLLPEARDAVRKVWGVEINNMWGCVEVGHIGIECDAHEGMHMTDDLIITEFVDDRNQLTRTPMPSTACSSHRYSDAPCR